ncbi:MAG: DUF1700 domain-containing protein [Eubacteriales bacterium]|nr:DUF1700 domain-containing protein [Eubacteriales bacterium]
MNRVEYIRQLEYLLQDIPEEEREDALSYYRDYLEEAGDEGEEQAIREFGSPERVAAIIRSDLNGSLENGGEFTEAGYQDERFRDPNYQVARRRDLPELHEGYADGSESGGSYDGKSRGASGGQTRHSRDYEDRTWFKRLLKVGLLLLLLGIAAPMILGVGSSALGILAVTAALLVAAVVCVGLLTIVAAVGAVALLVAGAGMLFVSPANGVLVLGGGVVTLGLALIGVALSVVLYGKWIPALIRWGVNVISNLLHRGRSRV